MALWFLTLFAGLPSFLCSFLDGCLNLVVSRVDLCLPIRLIISTYVFLPACAPAGRERLE